MRLYYFLFLLIIIKNNHPLYSQTNATNQSKIDSILTAVKAIADKEEAVDFLSTHISNLGYSKNTFPLIKKSNQLAQELGKDKLLAVANFYCANYYYYNSNLDSSLYYIEKTKPYIVDAQQPLLRAYTLATEGGIYKRQGNMPMSISKIVASQSLLDKLDTTKLNVADRRRYTTMTLSATNSLANYYNSIDEYEKAVAYYDKGYRKSLINKMFIPAGVFISNKGDLYLDNKQYQEAFEAFTEGKKLKLQGNAPARTIAISDLNIGYALSYLGKYQEAETYFNTSIDFFNNNNNGARLSESYLRRGSMFSTLGQTNEAINDCEKAKKLANENNEKDFLFQSCECLYVNYKAIGNTEKALENHEIFLTVKEEIFNEKNIKKQTEQELQYEFNKTQELKNAELKAKENESKLYSVLAVTAGTFAAFLGFFFYKNRKKNILLAKQKNLLEATVDEKNILLRETHHRVKNSFQMVSSLLFIQSETAQDKEAKLAIKEAQNRVRSMVLIHQKLYSKDQLVGIDAQEYMQDFTKDIIESHQFEKEKITYCVTAQPMVLAIETITPIGLILNELITNILKHAFPTVTKKSFMEVSFYKKDGVLVLKVADNGKGMPNTIKESSFGIELIEALSKKLKGTLTFENNTPTGTIANVTMRRFEVL